MMKIRRGITQTYKLIIYHIYFWGEGGENKDKVDVDEEWGRIISQLSINLIHLDY